MVTNTICRLPEVMAHTGLSRSSIYQKISINEFPPPISLGARAVGWLSDEVDSWIQGRINESRSGDSE